MNSLTYECFIRCGWEKYLNNPIGRREDPAHLADADICNSNSIEYLDEVISSTVYVMQMYKVYIINNEGDYLIENSVQRMNEIIHQVITSNDVNCIYQNIREFESIIEPYNINQII